MKIYIFIILLFYVVDGWNLFNKAKSEEDKNTYFLSAILRTLALIFMFYM